MPGPSHQQGVPQSKGNLNSTRNSGGPSKVPASTSTVRQKKGKDKPMDVEKICGHSIIIPPELPNILKQYAKGAMKTQPPDLLKWSGAYFRAVANGDVLPVKEKLEFPVRESPEGLTPGILRVIDTQLGAKSGQRIPKDLILKRWEGFGLRVDGFNRVLQRAQMASLTVIEWDNLIAVMASTIGKSLTETMSIICEMLTEQPDGMEPLVNYQMWWGLYVFLGTKIVGNVSADKLTAVDAYLRQASKANSGLIGPSDFVNNRCPPLE